MDNLPFARAEASIMSPLRYPGAKRRLAGYIERVISLNRLRPKLFVEPFAGGASVALQLLNNGVVERIGLIDRDPLIAAFWQTVFTDSDWLIEQVETVEVTLERWSILKQAVPKDRRGRALACLFLNRTSFSGILEPRAGPIGGKRQASAYSLDCRFPRATLTKRIRQAASLSSRVAFVWDGSWLGGLSRIEQLRSDGTLPSDVFFYFDPPFFEKADRLYTFFFTDADHRQLRDVVAKLDAPWFMSYDAVPQVEELYGANHPGIAQVELLYSTASTAGHRPAQEAIVTNLPHLPSETRLWRRNAEWRADKSASLQRGNIDVQFADVSDAAGGS